MRTWRCWKREKEKEREVEGWRLVSSLITKHLHRLVFSGLLCVLQADRLMFALHLTHGMHPELFQPKVSANMHSEVWLTRTLCRAVRACIQHCQFAHGERRNMLKSNRTALHGASYYDSPVTSAVIGEENVSTAKRKVATDRLLIVMGLWQLQSARG